MKLSGKRAVVGHFWRGFGGVMLLGVMLAGCSHKPPKPVDISNQIEDATVYLDQIEVTMLGKLDGPYYFIRAISPTVLELANMNAKTEQFSLIGLSDNGYPSEALVDSKAETPTPPPPTTAAELEKAQQIRLFKTGALEGLCGKSKLWIARMGAEPVAGAPVGIYLFLTQTAQANEKQLKGPATLINAEALAKGVANMELDGLHHPFYEKMLDCQLKAVAQSRHAAGASGGELWGRFGVKLPKGEWDDRRTVVEKNVQ